MMNEAQRSESSGGDPNGALVLLLTACLVDVTEENNLAAWFARVESGKLDRPTARHKLLPCLPLPLLSAIGPPPQRSYEKRTYMTKPWVIKIFPNFVSCTISWTPRSPVILLLRNVLSRTRFACSTWMALSLLLAWYGPADAAPPLFPVRPYSAPRICASR